MNNAGKENWCALELFEAVSVTPFSATQFYKLSLKRLIVLECLVNYQSLL